ncbi:maleylpyruvate isomerase family mycothiol-dependent enzyme [Saccharopolyspora sp. CA-218241]|uniref:maleylpyruvate isomerase family mycothiol-dependent enzyme n=1 Tax=Saccharopolyspora sp. CA-218241 TaxID=3240027 RepID=UPI003D9640F0
MDHDRCCDEIVAQSELLRSLVEGADPTVPVPSCPGWNLGQLVRHLGGGHRWAEEIVRTRAAGPPSDEHFRDLSRYADEDPAVLAPWLAEGAARLAEALRSAGPDLDVWAPLPGGRTAFLARRFAHETAIHRADAALALDSDFDLDSDVATDCLDEWLELGSLPQPGREPLLGPGRVLLLAATDAPVSRVVDLTGEVVTWRRGTGTAAVTARGPLGDLLLVCYRRRSPRAVDVRGDAALLDSWLAHNGFG